MASRAEELRKLAARVTTAAGDVSAVSGTSISEILDFMQKNLNVNGEGKLVVSEIKIPAEPGEGGEILSEPIYFNRLANGHYSTLVPNLGFEAGKTYEIRLSDGIDDSYVAMDCSIVPNEEIGSWTFFDQVPEGVSLVRAFTGALSAWFYIDAEVDENDELRYREGWTFIYVNDTDYLTSDNEVSIISIAEV